MPRVLTLKSIEGGKEFPRTAGALTVQKHRETYVVLADSLAQSPDDILTAQGLPAQGSTRGNMALVGLYPREVDPHALLWEVDAEWDSRSEGGSPDDEEDPVNLRPQVRWSYETMELPIAFDQVTGVPIENSVGEPFFITTPMSIPVRTFTRYERADVLEHYDALALAYGNRINSEVFHGWPPYTVYLAGIEAYDHVVRGELLSRVTYTTKYLYLREPSTHIPRSRYPSDVVTPITTLDVVGWKASLLNHGTKYRPDPDKPNEFEIFQTAEGVPTTGNLNIDGTKLEPASPRLPIPGGNFLRFFKTQIADLNELSI